MLGARRPSHPSPTASVGASKVEPARQLAEWIDEAAAALAGLEAPPTEAAVGEARAHALALVGRIATVEACRHAVLAFVGEALGSIAGRPIWPGDRFLGVVDRVAAVVGVPVDAARLAVHRRLFCDRRVLGLDPAVKVERQLQLLLALTPAREASLWTTGEEGSVRLVAVAGHARPGRSARAAALRTLAGFRTGAVETSRSPFHGVPVHGASPGTALVVRCAVGERAATLPCAHELAGTLALVLELARYGQRQEERERRLVEASERRMTRLGLDLHDGPLQEIALLTGDIRLFRQQLTKLLRGELLERAWGRVDDFEARLLAADRELRGIAWSFEAPVIDQKPLGDAIREEAVGVLGEGRVDVAVRVEGGASRLSSAQRVALFRIVQEALANIRDHAGASSVSIALALTPERTVLEIEDDGAGFDVVPTLRRAAKEGHLGLFGMQERARLLGGNFELVSRPGGPTKVRVTLPRSQRHAEPALEPGGR